MSDRTDPEVRKLAEEITQEIYGAGASLEVVNSITDGEAARTLARWESRLAQREAALQAQLHRALGEGARLREALSLVAPITAEALSASPLSERAGAVLAATEAERSTERELEAEWRRKGVFGDVDEKAFERKVRPYRVRRQVAVDALRAELQKGGGDA